MLHNIADVRYRPIPKPRGVVDIDWTSIRPALVLFADQHDLGFREVQCLVGAAHGMTNPAIAKELFISLDTVKQYFSRLFRKIDVSDRAQAVHWAWQHGLFVREAAA